MATPTEMSPITKAKVKSPLRWAGSKRKILPALAALWRNTDRTYIEAFAGSACLFFDLEPKLAILNDTNEDLISAYRTMLSSPLLLHENLCDLPVSSELYYQIRGSNPSDSFERAIRFFYLNRYCFNGIYRTNKAGFFNVPYGYRTGGFPSLNAWNSAAKVLSSARLNSLDFEQVVLDNVQAGDFVYLDPPYAVSNRRVFSQYSAQEFGSEDLKRLRSVMSKIDKCGATFVVSYAQSPETSLLEKGWASTRKFAQRNVAGFSHHRRKALEVIITNDSERFLQRSS